jgi:hypothetical protein
MVRYVVRCDHQHKFEAWFRSAADAERMLAPGQAGCPVCEKTEDEETTAPRAATVADRSVFQ